jgi:hypothetical protein
MQKVSVLVVSARKHALSITHVNKRPRNLNTLLLHDLRLYFVHLILL